MHYAVARYKPAPDKIDRVLSQGHDSRPFDTADLQFRRALVSLCSIARDFPTPSALSDSFILEFSRNVLTYLLTYLLMEEAMSCSVKSAYITYTDENNLLSNKPTSQVKSSSL